MSGENYPVASVVEQAVNNQVNALVGNKDVNLNTIVKMSLMNEMNQIQIDEMNEILGRIYNNNKAEDFYIKKEYELTYDLAGNLIPVNDIDGQKITEITTNPSGIILEPERSQ